MTSSWADIPETVSVPTRAVVAAFAGSCCPSKGIIEIYGKTGTLLWRFFEKFL
jgi:hypothetical protein